MRSDASEILASVDQLHQLTACWHRERPAMPKDLSWRSSVERLHASNFALWHHEDQARRLDLPDASVVAHKRSIDAVNCERNRAIEAIDDLALELFARGAGTFQTETMGMLIDRLSVLSLRMFHAKVGVGICGESRRDIFDAQWSDLRAALVGLLEGLISGTRIFRVYRQFKSVDQERCKLFDGWSG